MEFDQACRSADAPWSVITASPPNANLATVLAGFTITAIAFLLGREHADQKALHAVALFAPGVLVLALASNQFGGISAIGPPVRDGRVVEGKQYICSIAMTQGLAACGMLGVGFVVMIAGLAWTMAHAADAHLQSSANDGPTNRRDSATDIDARERKSLVHLGNCLSLIAIITVSLLLTRTSLHYIAMMKVFKLEPPPQLSFAVWTVFGLSAAVSAAVVGIRIRQYYRALTGDLVLPAQETVKARKIRRFPFISVVVMTSLMALFGPLYCGITAHRNAVPDDATAFFGLVVGMLLPCVIFVLIASSVPGPDFWYWTGSLTIRQQEAITQK